MKKFISLALLLSFTLTNTLPANAVIKSGVSETKQVKQEAKAKEKIQKQQDKELYKNVQKQKNIPYKKLKVTNKYDFINMPWWESNGT